MGDGCEEARRRNLSIFKKNESTDKNLLLMYHNTQVLATPTSARHTVEAICKYASYMRRQKMEMERWRKNTVTRIPIDMQYTHKELPSLSMEELEKLQLARPSNFAEAASISGMTSHGLVYLYHHVSKRTKRRDEERSKASGNYVEKEVCIEKGVASNI